MKHSPYARQISRRKFLASSTVTSLAMLAPQLGLAQSSMPVRQIPGTDKVLPIVGLGSSKVVTGIAENGPAPLEAVLEALIEHGGSMVDTWPRNVDNDGAFGEVISQEGIKDALFITTKIDQIGKQAGIDQFEQTLRLYQRDSVDLVQIFSLTDLNVHWPSLRDWKEQGKARYIGVTVSQEALYAQLEAFLKREKPDFIQLNYSIAERMAESRLLPMAADMGVGVIINRPFMNGSYFERLRDMPLPKWTSEFDCNSWAQFSLKYILANPLITCVLTETSNPLHMVENAMTASSQLPNEVIRKRMAEYIDHV
jgi:diketogulonate reductase-like aldo/keto reductase